MMQAAEIVLLVLATYLSLGSIVGLAFVAIGVDQVSAGAQGAGWMFRLLIFPGSVVLWPIVTIRWLQSLRGRTS